MDIKEHAKINEAAANQMLQKLKADKDESAFLEHLKSYIRLRYLLDDDSYWSDDLDEYSKYSIKKMMERSDDEVKLRDLGINCAGASSAMTKRLLLIISLRKGLDVELDPEAAASVDTVCELASLLQSALQQ